MSKAEELRKLGEKFLRLAREHGYLKTDRTLPPEGAAPSALAQFLSNKHGIEVRPGGFGDALYTAPGERNRAGDVSLTPMGGDFVGIDASTAAPLTGLARRSYPPLMEAAMVRPDAMLSPFYGVSEANIPRRARNMAHGLEKYPDQWAGRIDVSPEELSSDLDSGMYLSEQFQRMPVEEQIGRLHSRAAALEQSKANHLLQALHNRHFLEPDRRTAALVQRARQLGLDVESGEGRVRLTTDAPEHLNAELAELLFAIRNGLDLQGAPLPGESSLRHGALVNDMKRGLEPEDLRPTPRHYQGLGHRTGGPVRTPRKPC